MAFWLMKSEPDELSIQGLARQGEARWDGVRNYQARNFLRAMAAGDRFFFYHSSCPQPGIAGVGVISRAAYPDPTAEDSASPYYDPRSAKANLWSAVDVSHVRTFDRVIELPRLKALPELAEWPLVQKGSRLSVMPVSEAIWQRVMALAERQA